MLSATGAVNSTFTYQIVADSTGGAFRLDGDKLVVDDNAKLDFESAPQVDGDDPGHRPRRPDL